jgi:hypothetical protein
MENPINDEKAKNLKRAADAANEIFYEKNSLNCITEKANKFSQILSLQEKEFKYERDPDDVNLKDRTEISKNDWEKTKLQSHGDRSLDRAVEMFKGFEADEIAALIKKVFNKKRQFGQQISEGKGYLSGKLATRIRRRSSSFPSKIKEQLFKTHGPFEKYPSPKSLPEEKFNTT